MPLDPSVAAIIAAAATIADAIDRLTAAVDRLARTQYRDQWSDPDELPPGTSRPQFRKLL